MRDYIRPVHSRWIAACCGCVVVLIASSGCNSGSPELSKTEEAQMRAAFAKKGPINMNDLPADQQAKMKAFFQRGGGAPSAAPTAPAH